MDTYIYNGDFVPSGNGFKTVTGGDELLQKALICLAVKKGSFVLYPALGSELYRLKPGDGNLKAKALSAANEALLAVGLHASRVSVNASSDSISFDFSVDTADGSVSITV